MPRDPVIEAKNSIQCGVHYPRMGPKVSAHSAPKTFACLLGFPSPRVFARPSTCCFLRVHFQAYYSHTRLSPVVLRRIGKVFLESTAKPSGTIGLQRRNASIHHSLSPLEITEIYFLKILYEAGLIFPGLHYGMPENVHVIFLFLF